MGWDMLTPPLRFDGELRWDSFASLRGGTAESQVAGVDRQEGVWWCVIFGTGNIGRI